MLSFPIFALAGNATFTVTSLRTGTRFTYKIRQPKPESPHFVSVLTGPNNDENYTFLGTIFPGNVYVHGKRSTISMSAPAATAFNWLWNHRDTVKNFQIQINHAGKCCRCGRTLTVPASIESGIGPECESKMGL